MDTTTPNSRRRAAPKRNPSQGGPAAAATNVQQSQPFGQAMLRPSGRGAGVRGGRGGGVQRAGVVSPLRQLPTPQPSKNPSSAQPTGQTASREGVVSPRRAQPAVPRDGVVSPRRAQPGVPRNDAVSPRRAAGQVNSRGVISPSRPARALPTPVADVRVSTMRTGWFPINATVVAVNSFPGTGSHEMALVPGDRIRVLEHYGLWYKGQHIVSGTMGVFPKSFVVDIPDDGVPSSVKEAQNAIREWDKMLQRYFCESRMDEFEELKKRMANITEWYNKLTSPSSPASIKRQLENKIIQRIEEGRRAMGMDVIVRNEEGKRATDSNSGIMPLYQMHAALGQDTKTTKVATKKSQSLKQQPSQSLECVVILELKVFACSVGEPTEVLFSLYDREKSRSITEEFCVDHTAQGMPSNVDKIGNVKTVFTGLSEKDFDGDVYLFVRLVRRGRMQEGKDAMSTKDTKKNKALYRRPFGGAAMRLTNLSSEEVETMLPVYMSNSESAFAQLPELIAKNQGISTLQKAKGICVGIALLPGNYDTVVSRSPDLAEIPTTSRLGFSDSYTPDLQRQDLYVTFESGELASLKNSEVALTVKKNNGEKIENCIYLGCGEPAHSTFHCHVLHHTGSPVWRETVRINLEPVIKSGADVDNCHLFFAIKQASSGSSKEVGNAFMTLTREGGAMAKDGSHDLNVYKSGKQMEDPKTYLGDQSKLVPRKGESLKVSTLLCSTTLTANEQIHTLLNWRSSKENLLGVLKRFKYLTQGDVVKFLEEIFDAMFAILDADVTSEVQSEVYNSMVHAVGLLVDEKASRYTNFRRVIDSYIKDHMNSQRAYITLLRCLNSYFKDERKDRVVLLPSLKALESLLKIIIQSKKLELRQGEAEGMVPPNSPISRDEKFKADLRSLFLSFDNLMKESSPAMVGAQTIALKNFFLWQEQLLQVFTKPEMAEIVKTFITASDYRADRKRLNNELVRLLQRLVEGSLFDDASARNSLMGVIGVRFKTQAAEHMETEEAAHALWLLSAIFAKTSEKEKDAALQTLIDDNLVFIVNTTLSMHAEGHNETSRAASCLLSSLKRTPAKSFAMLHTHFNQEGKETEYGDLMRDMLECLSSSFLFPTNWFAMVMAQMRVTKEVLRRLSISLNSCKATASADYRNDLRLSIFRSSLVLLVNPALAVETFASSKQAVIEEEYGDLRKGICDMIHQMWKTMQEDEKEFVGKKIVAHVLNVALSSSKVLQKTGAWFYFSLMKQACAKEAQALSDLETETVDALTASTKQTEARSLEDFFDVLDHMASGKGFDKSDKNYIPVTPAEAQKLEQYLEHIKGTTNQVLTLKEPTSDDDDKTAGLLSMMEHMKNSGRMDAFIRYVDSLVESHMERNLYDTAGRILLMHADLYDWENAEEMVAETGQCKAQSTFQRKAELYRRAILMFDQGQQWEEGNRLLAELQKENAERMCDFDAVNWCLNQQAKFWGKIAKVERLLPEYFRVGFYGQGFPKSVRNKQFIYRGAPLERLTDFSEKMQRKYPQAEFLKSTEPPDSSVTESNKQQFQIFTVKPQQRTTWPKRMPQGLREFYEHNEAECFVYKKPFTKSAVKNKENEFKDLWTMHYIYKAKEAFPKILPMAEIVEVNTKETCPIENAIDTIQGQNNKLLKLAQQFENSSATNISPFTMVLSGTIDAAVAGGIDMYKQAFFSEEYIKENPNHNEFVDGLKRLFEEQLEVLDKCIIIHRGLVPSSMQQLQDHLELKLSDLKVEEKQQSRSLLLNIDPQKNWNTSGGGGATDAKSSSVLETNTIAVQRPISPNVLEARASTPSKRNLARNSSNPDLMKKKFGLKKFTARQKHSDAVVAQSMLNIPVTSSGTVVDSNANTSPTQSNATSSDSQLSQQQWGVRSSAAASKTSNENPSRRGLMLGARRPSLSNLPPVNPSILEQAKVERQNSGGGGK